MLCTGGGWWLNRGVQLAWQAIKQAPAAVQIHLNFPAGAPELHGTLVSLTAISVVFRSCQCWLAMQHYPGVQTVGGAKGSRHKNLVRLETCSTDLHL